MGRWAPSLRVCTSLFCLSIQVACSGEMVLIKSFPALPNSAPTAFKNLITACLDSVASQRPSFATVFKELQELCLYQQIKVGHWCISVGCIRGPLGCINWYGCCFGFHFLQHISSLHWRCINCFLLFLCRPSFSTTTSRFWCLWHHNRNIWKEVCAQNFLILSGQLNRPPTLSPCMNPPGASLWQRRQRASCLLEPRNTSCLTAKGIELDLSVIKLMYRRNVDVS